MDGLSGAFAALPPEAPMDMPVQSLDAPVATASRGPLPSAPHGMGLRRLVVIGGAVALTCVAGWQMFRVLDVLGSPTPLEFVLLALFVVLFAWIALAFTSAVAGFVAMLAGGGRGLGVGDADPAPPLATRTALLMPTYNEQPGRVCAGVQALHDALAEVGAIAAFDFFILSDTTDPDVWIAEEAAFLALRARTHEARMFYRRRAQNTERKAGNIADWVRRWGGAYPQFLILDADSVMTADSVVRLAHAMETHADVGLIQTLPVIVNARTLFARMQQFAGRVYGPVIAQGIAWWHGAEGNYWGHNAMIRTAAFAAHAGLPQLRGRKPFGGHILSHDFVEATLLRRAGWAVHMVPALAGSYEEGPPSLTDLAVRDRRWCQGNLQHAAVVPARGLHWVSRMHLLMGIGSYVTAPLWLLFLLTGILLALQARFVRPEYFSAEPSLFPRWPQIDPVRAMWVFGGTMAVLLAPKLFGWIALQCDPAARRGCGGTVRSFASLLIETLIGGLIAPVAMMIQSAGVASILLGRDSGWNPQRRDDGRVAVRVVVRGYAWHTAFGLVLAVAAYAVSPLLAAWMLPVLLGLALAIPLAGGTASVGAGRALRRIGLLRTPEETAPPPVLVAAMALQQQDAAPDGEAVRRLLGDAALLAAHRAMLASVVASEPLRLGLAKLDESVSLEAALASLAPREKAAVLASPRGLDRILALAGR